MISLNTAIKNSDLNKEQLKAAIHKDGPLLIIAGPGSGKTKTLVERIVFMILDGIQPESIMVATFTEKAAKELVTRVSNRLIQLDIKVNLNEMYIGTLHSIFLRILEENREYTRLKRSYRLLDDFEQRYMIFRNLKEYQAVENSDLIFTNPRESRWEKTKTLIYYLSKVSEECLDVDVLCNAEEPEIQVIGEFYKIYETQLFEENAVDFSTIQTETLYLLENNPKILKTIKAAIRYIMIDEYQDTNTIQERIILKLAGKEANLCVVGDDDQGLYRFRGATIRNILEFPKNFKKGQCQQIKLEVNYRSHPGIINFYNKWMNSLEGYRPNGRPPLSWTDGPKQFRYPKEIVPKEAEFPKTASVIRIGVSGENADYFEQVYNFIIELQRKKVLTDLNQIAFLFKSVKNENVIDLANYLEERDIKVFSPRSALFFERPEVQLLIGAILFMFPTWQDDVKWNDEANLDIWDTYRGYEDFFARTITTNREKNKSLIQYCKRKRVQHENLKQNTNYAFTALIYQLLEYPLFAEYVTVDMNENKSLLRAAYNVGQLTQLLFRFEYIYNIDVLSKKFLQKNLQDLLNTYFRYIIDGGIEEYENFDEFSPSGCVSFMTIHQSKGLEFPIVFVGSLNNVPTKSFSPIDVTLQDNYYHKEPFEPIDETKYFDFWRLYYTAFSRPQNLLILTTREAQARGRGKSPSAYFERHYNNLPRETDKAFNMKKLELDVVRPPNIKKEYSFTSHILLYENCPLQYKFYKELEFTEVRTGSVLSGTLLHQTIEDIHKAVLEGQREKLTDSNITEWFNINYALLSKANRTFLHQAQLKSILNQVIRYRDSQSNNWDRILDAEFDVSLVKEEYILKGTIDLIEGDNDTVELIDFKSGDKPDVNSNDPKDKEILHQYQRQLEVYAHLVEERKGKKVSKMHLYYPKEENSSPYITFKANKDNIQHTINVFDEVVKNIEIKNYDMSRVNKTEKQCGNCDMRFHCNPNSYEK